MAQASPALRHLAHLVALTSEGRIDSAADDLVATTMALDDGACTAEQIREAVAGFFGIELPRDQTSRSLDRLESKGSVIRAGGDSYHLSAAERTLIEIRSSDAAAHERRVREEWLASLPAAPVIGEGPSGDVQWATLLAFLTRLCQRHGAETLMLLSSQEFARYADGNVAQYMAQALRDAGVASPFHSYVSENVRAFLLNPTPERTRYIAELLDGTFTFFALGSDESTTQLLRGQLPRLDVFLDTNFIYGLLGLNDDELGELSQQLVAILTSYKFPFRLYYHARTLIEATRTLDTIGDRLRSQHWTKSMSSAAVRAGTFSSVELRYHQANLARPTDPDAFMARYRNVAVLLEALGVKIFRADAESPEDEERRWRMVANYIEFKKNLHPDRTLRYEAADHDVAVWLAVQERRVPARSTLHAGAVFLSADRVLQRYDRDVARKWDPAQLGSVVLPSQMVQLVRPFVPATASLDDAFAKTISIPEFRRSSSGYTRVATKILSYLNTLEDLPEDTAVEILQNELVIAQLRPIQDDDKAFAATLDTAIGEANRRLHAEIERLRAELATAPASPAHAVAPEPTAAHLAEVTTGISPFTDPMPHSAGTWSSRVGAGAVATLLALAAWHVLLSAPRMPIEPQPADRLARAIFGAVSALSAAAAISVAWDGVVRGEPHFIPSMTRNTLVRGVFTLVAGAIVLAIFGINPTF